MQLIDLGQIDSIVVAGGQASRINGIDKVMLPLGTSGNPLLLDVVLACPGRVIVAGAPRDIPTQVVWVSDFISGGGPAAGIWAGLSEVNSEYVFISAADQQVTAQIVTEICQAALGYDGAWAVRADGQGQPLLACVKTQKIKDLLAQTQGQNVSPLRLMERLNMIGVKVNEGQIKDVDTWQDVAKLIKETAMSDVTPIWLAQVAALLNISEKDIPVDALLDLTREVAHNVERKSAPLTTFLIGLAAGKTDADLTDLIKKVTAAIEGWNSDAKS